MIAVGDVTAGTQDYLSRAPARGDAQRADLYLTLGGELAEDVLARDPAAGVRFQTELFKKFPDRVDAGVLWNAAASLERRGRTGPAGRLLDRILGTQIDTPEGAAAAAKRATDAFARGDRETMVRYARVVVNNPSADPEVRREMVNYLLAAQVSPYELEEPLGPVQPEPDPAFGGPAGDPAGGDGAGPPGDP